MPRPLTLKAHGRKAPELGPKVRVDVARLVPSGAEGGLAALVKNAGLSDWDKDGLLEHGTAVKTMWKWTCPAGSALEFELPEAVPLNCLEIWNYNAEWQTTNGIRKADIAVSAEGDFWKTVVRGVEFAQAEGRNDYDEPIVIQLKGVSARRVRLENLAGWGEPGKVGLSKVVFHEAVGNRAAVAWPEDGATGITIRKPTLKWIPGKAATEHRLYLGTNASALELSGSTKASSYELASLLPNTSYFWRIDEVQNDGSVVPGRVLKFGSAGGLVGWWKFGEKEGKSVADASGGKHQGTLKGKAKRETGPNGLNALEFDGKGTHINFGKSQDFDLRSAVSVCAWVKVRNFDKEYQAVLTKGADGYRLRRDNRSGTLTFDCNGLSARSGPEARLGAATRRRVDDGKWHHVVGLYDGTQLAIYLDGKLENRTACSGEMKTNGQALLVGKDFAGTDRSWDGWIADVRVYAYALSAEEIQQIYGGAASERAAGSR